MKSRIPNAENIPTSQKLTGAENPERIGLEELTANLQRHISAVKNKNDLHIFFNTQLKSVLAFDKAVLLHQNPKTKQVYCYLQTDVLSSDLFGFADGTNANQQAFYNKMADWPPIRILDQNKGFTDTGYPNLLANNLNSLLVAKLSALGNAFGCLCLIRDVPESFGSDHIKLLEKIEPQLSATLAAIIQAENLEKKERESDILLALSNSIASIRNKLDLFEVIDQHLKKLFHFEDFVICLINDDEQTHSAFIYNHQEDFQRQEGIAPAESRKYTLDDGMCRAMIKTTQPVIFNVQEVLKWPDAPAWLAFWDNMGIREMIALKLTDREKCIGFFYLYAKKTNAVSNVYYGLLQNISLQISVAVANIKANEKIEQQLQEINTYKQQLEDEKTYLKEEIDLKYKHSEIIGQSEKLKYVFHLSEQVAPSDSTVLIFGETGTGKELLARSIHNMSPRKNNLMVKVNCAALPSTLAESELFGHEKGSFTGATERRIGKFELAHKGTLFLDEIGELSLDLQVKLLRALQEKEIERVGGNQLIKTDVRIVAATNRNLLKEVEKGNFRSDLFYRLNVFPIQVPPLRERKEDIVQLAAYFIGRIAKKTGRPVNSISKSALNKLQTYPWPGNIRELEHLIERNLLLSTSDVIKEIHLPKIDRKEQLDEDNSNRIKTIYENEREHILSILKLCNGKISGSGGAAEALNIPATTLNSKIKKFNIKRSHFQN